MPEATTYRTGTLISSSTGPSSRSRDSSPSSMLEVALSGELTVQVDHRQPGAAGVGDRRPGHVTVPAGKITPMSTTGDDVRAYALSLPETTEEFAWQMPIFRVARSLFLTLPDDETSMAVRCPVIDRDELVAAEPAKFWIAPHEANNAWVRVRLAALDDHDELRAIVLDSWKLAAPKRLLDGA